jgi:hypothetical protein
MTLKQFWAGTGKWLRGRKPFTTTGSQPQIDEDGLISQNDNPAEPEKNDASSNKTDGDQVMVKTVQPMTPQESLEKLQNGFEKLVEQLEGINEHLNRQASQHENLMGRLERLPQMLESFPEAVENQKRIIEELLEQFKGNAAKDEQFMDAVGRIPNETAKQTDALVKIDQQLAAAANIDVQMSQSFNNFNETLERLNQTSIGQTDGILQMSKTFAASDRYLKYIISKQSKRFMWIFIATISVCTACILTLAGIIIYLNR